MLFDDVDQVLTRTIKNLGNFNLFIIVYVSCRVAQFFQHLYPLEVNVIYTWFTK